MIDKNNISKGVVYLYLEAISIMFSGYIYWLILSKIASSSVIGTSSSIISLITIFAGFASMGVGGGIQRFLSKGIVEKKKDDLKDVINSSILIVSLGIIISTIVIVIFKDNIFYSFKIDTTLILLSILTTGLTIISGLLRSIMVPSLKTKVIAISAIISTVIKMVITIILVSIGIGVSGIIIGFLSYSITSSLILVIAVKGTYYYQENKNHIKKSMYSFLFIKDIFHASIVFWIPGIITTIGSQLGTIFVFVSNGATNAGIYYISFSLVSGISLIMSVLSTIAYPSISAMKDGRKRAVWRFIKVSLIIILPLSNALIPYSPEVLQLFGSSYIKGAPTLAILLLSILPTALISGIGVLVYAYSNNRQVLLIGLFTSIPRTLLYFIFVPFFGEIGAALTYLFGSIIGCIISLIIAKNSSFKILWKQITYIFILPLLLASILKLINLNYVIAICITIILSFIIFIKGKIVDTEDIKDIFKILPKRIADQMLYINTKIFKKLK